MSDNKSNYALLQSAIREGNYRKTKELVNEFGIAVDDKWTDYEILIDAVKTANPKLVQLLLNHGCRVNKPRANVYTPLHCAVANNYVEIVKILLENGANSSAKWNDFTPLHVTIDTRSTEVVKLLLAYKANVCAKDRMGGTPIHRAYQIDRPNRHDFLDLMLKIHGGKMANSICREGMSIFHVACTRNFPDVVENFLQSKVDVNSRIATRGEPYSGFTGLHFAAMYYQVDVIRVLLKYKADVNALCERGLSPLWMATKYIFMDEIAYKLNESIFSNYKTFVKILSGDEMKEIMEFMSKEVRNIETIKLLLKNKSNTNVRNKKGNTLFFEAYVPRLTFHFSDGIPSKITVEDVCKRFFWEGRQKVMKLLIKNGINVNVITTISLCGEKGSILHYIANNTVNNTCVPGWTKITKMILKNGGDPDVKSSAGETPLHKAVKIGFYECVCLLLQFKANPNVPDNDKRTPLHYARKENIIKVLVDSGADVNVKDKNGEIPSLKVDKNLGDEGPCPKCRLPNVC